MLNVWGMLDVWGLLFLHNLFINQDGSEKILTQVLKKYFAPNPEK